MSDNYRLLCSDCPATFATVHALDFHERIARHGQ